jgi:hypothetical protein
MGEVYSLRTYTRLALVAMILTASGAVGVAWLTSDARSEVTEYERQSSEPLAERDQVADPRPNMTVVTGLESNLRDTHALYAFGADGRLRYYENTKSYGDVDPSSAGSKTVLVAASDMRGESNCERACTWQYVKRVNLSTGERETVYKYNTPHHRATIWHDVDHVGGDSILIAGIWTDEVWQVNTSTGVTEWGWKAQNDFDIRGGGPYWWDWAHLNDVERLPDGRVMASLRNQDQVVFIHPERGLQANWTLGCEDCWGTLFEQHNPDYIPADRGGPAVLVADSENNRVVEFQRRNGSWVQTWEYDRGLDWPRDADRLPNGNTLIADSHSNRIIEVAPNGSVVWEQHIANPYEAERLGTGDESAGGPSAVRAGLESVNTTATYSAGADLPGANEGNWGRVAKAWHGIKFLLPVWVDRSAFAALLLAVLSFTALLTCELYWRGVRLRVPIERSER